jgi:hypothetical protein
VRKRYRDALFEAVLWYLEDDRETEVVVAGALEQAERQWGALEGEANVLHLLAMAAVDQIERLLPRPWNRLSRRVPTVAQLTESLSLYQFDRRVAEMRAMLDVMKASARERGGDTEGGAQIAELEAMMDRLVSTFYKGRLPWDEDGGDDPQFGGAVCPVTVPPPMRGPGEGRTFSEALAPARNP